MDLSCSRAKRKITEGGEKRVTPKRPSRLRLNRTG
jgi:hypothetical protein